MAKIIDLINSARESGEWPDDLESVLAEDITEAIGPYQGKIDQMIAGNEISNSEREELLAKITALQAHNYELQNSTPISNDDEDNADSDDGESGIDALFEEKE